MKTIAIIGCGRIANNAHFPALKKIEDVQIKYVCDLIVHKAQAAKEKFAPQAEAITDYKVALSDKEIDGVLVLTPYYAHYTINMDALKAENMALWVALADRSSFGFVKALRKNGYALPLHLKALLKAKHIFGK